MAYQDLDPTTIFSQRHLRRAPSDVFAYTSLHTRGRSYTALVTVDGSGGSFKSIWEAIAFTKRQGGGVVFIANGTYIIDRDITMYDNIKLVGEDQNNTILNFNSGAYQIKAIGTSPAPIYNLGIENLFIKECILTDVNDHHGCIYWKYVVNSYVQNCRFNNTENTSSSDAAGILIENGKRCVVRYNYHLDDEIGIWVTGDDIDVYGNFVDDATSMGIICGVGNNIWISNNRVYNTDGAGIWVEGSDNARVIGNFVDTFNNYGITTGENN